MKNTSTKFTEDNNYQVDSRIFFQDISLDDLEIWEEYKTLISSKFYTSASEKLNDSKIDFYGAWLFNLFENRLEAIGSFLKKNNKPTLQTYSRTEPTAKNGLHWIE
jgi:hypothetical protein